MTTPQLGISTTSDLSGRLPTQKPLPSEIDVFGCTHPGRVRATNADHFLVASFYRAMKVHASSLAAESFPPLSTYTRGFLFLVADGVGGFSQAAEGSARAVQTVTQSVLNMGDVCMQSEPWSESEVAERLHTFVLAAHDALRGDLPPGGGGVNATTFTMVIAIWPRYFVIHCGDSRAYRFRKGALQRLTRDQTMAEAMIEAGAMTREAAEASHLRHVLVSALGSPQLEPEVRVTDSERGDKIFCCSDGLTKHVEEAEIARRLGGAGNAESICRDLLDLALQRGGEDNITVLLGQARTTSS
jgi:PPM family protein phosphatase